MFPRKVDAGRLRAKGGGKSPATVRTVFNAETSGTYTHSQLMPLIVDRRSRSGKSLRCGGCPSKDGLC
jgi:hypothetical protein